MCLRVCLLLLLLMLPAVRAQDDILDELDDQMAADAGWWDAAWPYQQPLLITDPNLRVVHSPFLVLDQPQPRLLANTGRLRRDFADLRIVDTEGQALPCGVLNPDLDDGSCRIWCKLPSSVQLMGRDKPLRLILYYGNPKAEPLGVASPVDYSDPLTVRLLDEQAAKGETLPKPPLAGVFHDSLVVAECEYFVDSKMGHDAFVSNKTPNRRLFAFDQDNPSGGYYLCTDYPWRQPSHHDYPVIATSEVTLPKAGIWYVYVRYRVTDYVYPAGERLHPKRIHFKMSPFKLKVGDQELTCGENQDPGALFRYSAFKLELPAGELPLTLTMAEKAGPDCVLFTQNPDYLPDVQDFTGPLWLRLRVTRLPPPATRFQAQIFCVITPWSTHGPQGEYAGILFRDRVAPDLQDAEIQARDSELWLRQDDWSPWVQLMQSSMPKWWTNLIFIPDQGPGMQRGMQDVQVEFQLATRPTGQRVFRTAVEETGAMNHLSLLMPNRPDLKSILDDAMSFDQWADKRYRQLAAMGLKPIEGPQQIILTTMATANSPAETESIMRTCSVLGFNGIDMRSPMPREEFWKLADSLGLGDSTAHHWYPKIDYTTWPEAPPAGTTAADYARALIKQVADITYAPGGPRWRELDNPRTRLLIMGDEIGPATNPPIINNVPLIERWFHEFLAENQLTPAFFGKTSWDEVKAFWYREVSAASELGRAVSRLREAKGLEPLSDYDGPKPPVTPDEELAPTGDDPLEDSLQAMMAAEEVRQVAERTVTLTEDTATPEEKRLYYWTQKFRGAYTCALYGAANRAIRQSAAEGNFKVMPMASPNFQALPIMRTQMWEGALNLFEWARAGTTDSLLIEDWIMHPYRVAFGMGVLRSAARKHGQEIGLLIVGGNMKTRFLAALGQGTRGYLSYLYGPLRVIGPPWADHEPTIRMWSELTHAVHQTEPDLIASHNRPAEAAILFAVTNDINSPYIRYTFQGYPMGERAHIWVALQDSQIPAEILSEEEILEDPEALARYKVLYVGDLHVREAVQAKIRDWVAAGGTLWGSYAALARQEYDEPTTTFDDVFGLAKRPPIAQAPETYDPATAVPITVPAGIDGLTPTTFDASPIELAWELSTAEPLATYADGKPAFIHNRFGQGHAYLLGAATMPLTGGYSRLSAEPPYAAATRRLVAIAAERAGVQRHLRLSHPRVINFVHDGPDQSVVFLVSAFEEDIEALQVSVALPRQPTTAINGRGEKIAFTWHEDHAEFTTALAKMDGAIIVFHYETAQR